MLFILHNNGDLEYAIHLIHRLQVTRMVLIEDKYFHISYTHVVKSS